MENPFKKGVDENIKIEVQDVEETTEETTEQKEEQNENTEVTEPEAETAEQETTAADEYKEKYEHLNNQYLRLAADFENFRKRNDLEREALLKYGAENTLKSFLEVLDNFERGLKAIETVDDCEKVKECYNLAYKNFTDAMKKVGLETINAEGEAFDPNFHEAVMQTPSSDKPEHTIIAELQKGYKLGDKVLRPALVNVAVSE